MKFVINKLVKFVVMKSIHLNRNCQFLISFFCLLIISTTASSQRSGHGGGGFGGSRGGGSFSSGSTSSSNGSFHSSPAPTPAQSPSFNRAPISSSPQVNRPSIQGNTGNFPGRNYQSNNNVSGNNRGGIPANSGKQFVGANNVNNQRGGYSGHNNGYGHGGYGGGRGHFSPYYVYPYYPSLGVRLGFLPFGYYSFYFDEYPYYYYNSVFYRRTDDNNYEVVTPPLGAHVPTIPNNSKGVIIDGNKYFESSGTYYQEELDANNHVQYKVVGVDDVLNQPQNQGNREPQIGDIIPQLPNGCTTIFLNGQKYYEAPNNIYYQEIQDGDRIAYKIVGK